MVVLYIYGRVINAYWYMGSIALVVGVISLFLSIWKAGKIKEDGSVRLYWYDKIFPEVHIIAGISVAAVGALLVYLAEEILCASEEIADFLRVESLDWYRAWEIPVGILVGLWLILAIGLVLYEFAVVQSLTRQIKAGKILRYTVLGRIITGIQSRGGRSSTKNKTEVKWRLGARRKVILICLAITLVPMFIAFVLGAFANWYLGFGVLLVLIVIAVLLSFIYYRMTRNLLWQYQEIEKGVDRMSQGELNYQIPLSGNGELAHLAEGINAISEAGEIAVQKELKNQKMKTELISNVSHDLRTPLTSMVTYVDLLKTEGLGSEHAPEYLDILDQKTQRLQKLTEDLFEAAKASSGDIPVELDRIEMSALVNQALAELEENLSKNHIQMIFNQSEQGAYVYADGQHLWRIMENLLTNIGKYAMEGTRAYLDLYEEASSNGPMTVLAVKNISREPLNITSEELMERFARGDSSRSTDGSGLGLSIAKDLAELMGGSFDVVIDGDLFKAVVKLRSAALENGLEESLQGEPRQRGEAYPA